MSGAIAPFTIDIIMGKLNTRLLEGTTSWHIYFSIQYYLGCCPFRICLENPNKKLSHTSKFIIQTFWPQTIFCFLADLSLMPWILVELRNSIPADRRNSSLYLSTLLAITTVPIILIIKGKFWFGRASLLRTVNKFASTPMEIPRKLDRMICHRYAILSITLLWAGIGITTWCLGRGLWSERMWTVELWWSKVIEAGYHNLFLNKFTHTSLDPLVGIFSGLGFLQW